MDRLEDEIWAGGLVTIWWFTECRGPTGRLAVHIIPQLSATVFGCEFRRVLVLGDSVDWLEGTKPVGRVVIYHRCGQAGISNAVVMTQVLIDGVIIWLSYD